MSYTPPRGRCNFKASLMSPACPCLRFMLHPVKAATSFECDGCAHHASFHSMENAAEDAVVRKWAEEEKRRVDDTGTGGQAAGGAGRKRRRLADVSAQANASSTARVSEGGTWQGREIMEITDDEDTEPGDDMLGSIFNHSATSSSRPLASARSGTAKGRPSNRGKGK